MMQPLKTRPRNDCPLHPFCSNVTLIDHSHASQSQLRCARALQRAQRPAVLGGRQARRIGRKKRRQHRASRPRANPASRLRAASLSAPVPIASRARRPRRELRRQGGERGSGRRARGARCAGVCQKGIDGCGVGHKEEERSGNTAAGRHFRRFGVGALMTWKEIEKEPRAASRAHALCRGRASQH